MKKSWMSRWSLKPGRMHTGVLLGGAFAALVSTGCVAPTADAEQGAGASDALKASATVSIDWNLLLHTIAVGPLQSRTAAMVHLAMFDAVNSVTPQYSAYLVSQHSNGASSEAAAAQAAYRVLIRLVPGGAAALDAQLAT